MGASRSTPFRVQLVIGPDLAYFRDVVLGARHLGFSTGSMTFADRWLDYELRGDLRKLVRRDNIDGIVATIHTLAEEQRFTELGIPVVNVSNSILRPRIPVVTQDDVAVGRLAAAHLQACGCRAFGFWGQTGASYSDERLHGFRQGLAPGAKLAVHSAAGQPDRDLHARMRNWLGRLPRPLGLFAVLDTHALALMRAARELGWRVPEDVAMLGAGDEDFWVEFETVPLSSIRLPARRIGHEAAALLHRLMKAGTTASFTCGAGADRRARRKLLPGAEIVARRSTDLIYADDQAVTRAVRFIREHAENNPYITDVARAAGVSRTALQTRFRAALGRTVLQEIQRVRVDRAQRLLTAGELNLAEIAERCGFPNSQRFSVLFRQLAGISPSAYRAQFRKR